MYSFERINHGLILTYAVLTGLTPLIPIPFVDDWIKAIFLRGMVRQIAQARGLNFNNETLTILTQEDFWDNCFEGCVAVVFRLLRELFSKVFFWIEWRRAINTLSITYYTGFLLDAALLDGWAEKAGIQAGVQAGVENAPAAIDPQAAAALREAIRRARYQANLKLIQRLIRPLDFLSAAWALIRRSIVQTPRLLANLGIALWQGIKAAPSALWRGLTGFPRRVRENFYQRIQVLLGREKAPELQAVQRLVRSMLDALLKIDSAPFDELHERFVQEIEKLELAES